MRRPRLSMLGTRFRGVERIRFTELGLTYQISPVGGSLARATRTDGGGERFVGFGTRRTCRNAVLVDALLHA